MSSSGILEDVLHYRACRKAQASHFVLCNGARMRYLISLNGGTAYLVRSVAAYGGKLAFLLRLLRFIPFQLLRLVRLGYYVQADLHPAVNEVIPPTCHWNMLIGTYDEKQKIVLQCFSRKAPDSTFVKVGNEATEKEMNAEISFFCDAACSGRLMELPGLLSYRLRRDGHPFNLLVTREFHGRKVVAELTKDICSLWREIADIKRENRGGDLYEFSHGDFTPWNLRYTGTRYIVFDWEHCGMKPYGYDLMYYAVVLRLACKGMGFEEAYADSLADIRRYIPDFEMDKQLFYHLLTEVITPDGF